VKNQSIVPLILLIIVFYSKVNRRYLRSSKSIIQLSCKHPVKLLLVAFYDNGLFICRIALFRVKSFARVNFSCLPALLYGSYTRFLYDLAQRNDSLVENNIVEHIFGKCRAECAILINRRQTDRRITIRYDTRCYFNVRSKADMSQLNLPEGIDN